MNETLSSEKLDEQNPNYVDFLGFGEKITSIIEELKSEVNPENRYNLLNAYYNLVMLNKFGLYLKLK